MLYHYRISWHVGRVIVQPLNLGACAARHRRAVFFAECLNTVVVQGFVLGIASRAGSHLLNGAVSAPYHYRIAWHVGRGVRAAAKHNNGSHNAISLNLGA